MMGKPNKPTKQKRLSSEDIAYIAGLVDGEGCINIYRITTDYIKNREKRKVPKFVLSVAVNNCDYTVLRWIYDVYGGYLQKRVRNNPKWRQGYAWRLSANKANDFLKEIYPYLRIKQKQAQVAIDFQDNQSRFHRAKKGKKPGMSSADFKLREDCWKKLKELNHAILD